MHRCPENIDTDTRVKEKMHTGSIFFDFRRFSTEHNYETYLVYGASGTGGHRFQLRGGGPGR